ncbi:S27A2 synthetase, partial [Grallaria varia]|nr:S27A2 synthetase [Grallaria varia]
PPRTLLAVFELRARRCPERPLLRFQERLFTYGEVEGMANRAARALWHRLAPPAGTAVAVFLPNSPEYVWTWLALAKLGCAMACVNTNARGRALTHALDAAGATVMITCPGEMG